jgi:hypothetical protein
MHHLRGAIGAAVTNYKGQPVKSIPAADMPEVIARLGIAAKAMFKMPCQHAGAATNYVHLHNELTKLGMLNKVGCCA